MEVVISWVFVIREVTVVMGAIFNGYGPVFFSSNFRESSH